MHGASALSTPAVRPGHHTVGYLPLSRSVVRHLSDSPCAVGVAALISRRFLLGDSPTWVSRNDLRCYDPAITTGAASRALRRIVSSGAAMCSTTDGKYGYSPCWGIVDERPVAYARGEANFGCPRHIAQIRVDLRLLDLFLGKFDPHHRHPAQITRYVTQPLLSLVDVGTYILLQANFAVEPTPRLRALGLVRDGVVQPLPDDATMLALVSQQAITQDTPVLTESGWARMGVVRPQGAVADRGTALFFVPPGEIGGWIADQIGPMIADQSDPDAGANTGSSALQREATPRTLCHQRSHAEIHDHAENPVPPPPLAAAGVHADHAGAPAAAEPLHGGTAPPLTTEDYLITKQVMPEKAKELDGCALADAQAAFAVAACKHGIKDQTAYAVWLLQRAKKTGEPIQMPTQAGVVDWAELARQYNHHAAPPPTPVPATTPGPVDPPVPATPCDAAAITATVQHLATVVLLPTVPQVRDQMRLIIADTITLVVPPALLPACKTVLTPPVLRRWGIAVHALVNLAAGTQGRLLFERPAAPALSVAAVLDQIRALVPAAVHAQIDALTVITAPGQVIIKTATAGCALGTALDAACQQALTKALGVPIAVHVPPAPSTARPPWIAAATWDTLPVMLQHTLSGSTLTDTGVAGRAPYLTKQLHTYYAERVAALVDAAAGIPVASAAESAA